ncbi:MAG TPA: roadblock/LC7 domain-containing protein [Longimicrobiaceae bacterium]|nr:roadblock/LC7 domain-containing protein [Longimicrobiaceae bacterium]
MPQLDETLASLYEHDGVEHVLLLGRDGLLVRSVGPSSALDADTVAAMVPGVVSTCTALARAAGRGAFATAAVEVGEGVVLVAALSGDLLLAILLRSGVGFAPLLRELRSARGELADLV